MIRIATIFAAAILAGCSTNITKPPAGVMDCEATVYDADQNAGDSLGGLYSIVDKGRSFTIITPADRLDSAPLVVTRKDKIMSVPAADGLFFVKGTGLMLGVYGMGNVRSQWMTIIDCR